MSIYEKLETGFVNREVGETICTNCTHVEVCGYKQAYLEYLSACEKLRNDYPKDISFIKKRDPECNFYKRKAEINYRQASVKS